MPQTTIMISNLAKINGEGGGSSFSDFLSKLDIMLNEVRVFK